MNESLWSLGDSWLRLGSGRGGAAWRKSLKFAGRAALGPGEERTGDVKFQTPDGRVTSDFRAGRGAGGGLLWSAGKALWEKGGGTEPLKVGQQRPDEEGPKVLTSPGNGRLVWEDRWEAVGGPLGGGLWTDLLTWSRGGRRETDQGLRCASSLASAIRRGWGSWGGRTGRGRLPRQLWVGGWVAAWTSLAPLSPSARQLP